MLIGTVREGSRRAAANELPAPIAGGGHSGRVRSASEIIDSAWPSTRVHSMPVVYFSAPTFLPNMKNKATKTCT